MENGHWSISFVCYKTCLAYQVWLEFVPKVIINTQVFQKHVWNCTASWKKRWLCGQHQTVILWRFPDNSLWVWLICPIYFTIRDITISYQLLYLSLLIMDQMVHVKRIDQCKFPYLPLTTFSVHLKCQTSHHQTPVNIKYLGLRSIHSCIAHLVQVPGFIEAHRDRSGRAGRNKNQGYY